MRVFVASTLLLTACSKPASEQPKTPAPAAPAAQAAAPKAAVKRVDACSLFTKVEVEALLGHPVLEGGKSEVAELSACAYGNPKTPLVGGKPTDIVLRLAVFSGEMPGQAKGAYDIAKSNAAKVQALSGLGDEAFWDELTRTLRSVKGNSMVEVGVGSDVGGLTPARAIAEKALAKLP